MEDKTSRTEEADVDSIHQSSPTDEERAQAVEATEGEARAYNEAQSQYTEQRRAQLTDLVEAHVYSFVQNIEERRRYASFLSSLLGAWMFGVLLIVALSGGDWGVTISNSPAVFLSWKTLFILAGTALPLLLYGLDYHKHSYKKGQKKSIRESKSLKRHRRLQYVKFLVVVAVIFFFAFTTWSVDVPALDLKPSVLIALISGATINVIGLFAIVTQHLFPGRSEIKELVGVLEKMKPEK